MEDDELPYALRDFPATPIEVSSPDVWDICEQFGLGLQDTLTVHRAFLLTLRRFAPFNTWLAAGILRDLRREVARDRSVRIAFVARDGHVLAAAVRGLDPELFDRYCTEIRVSRKALEPLWKDAAGGELPLDEKAFRGYKGSFSAETAAGAVGHARAYLRERGLPVDSPGARVVLVDNGLRGSIGEVFHLVFGWDTFSHLGVASVPARHPRPDRIKGHLVHAGPDAWRGQIDYLPDEWSRTFLSSYVMRIWETFTSGPLKTVDHIGPDGPVAGREATWVKPRIPRRWANPRAVLALRTSVLLAAHTHAVAQRSRRLGKVMRRNRPGRDRFVADMRRLVRGDPTLDSEYADMMWTTSHRRTAPTSQEWDTEVMNSFTAKDPSMFVPTPRAWRIPGITSRMVAFRAPTEVCVKCPDPPPPIALPTRIQGRGLELRR
ncbi:hypothetical protein LO772_01235 [Yinghuangia sp. ASG 101]|uniref:hypothetical protein n=1 Tax=Yinghuangia sp. ASG 101 TaxID=2896848 RepID=UPI001E37F6BA|nr:hypothetical protein [Yinghuangia sp. ASG 101]UGQ12266.1 hypothetical protein LO772_01235 [Yinghuangia sp. ASG 101]